jgi:Membrane proteins related to metalloendopeptidases
MRRIATVLLLVWPALAAATPITLELPLDCSGTRCTVQKYFDVDPGPGRMDYSCGRLTNDGDTATDIRVPDFPTMERGVPVLAAAPGVVRVTRDGMDDVSVRTIGREALGGRDAGNKVVIDHGDGWVTQYSHMRKGSILVKPGQQVEAGQQLGLIGLSGKTEFPHLNFLVHHDGRKLDPFIGLAPFHACGDARQPLWSPAALAALPYRPTGPLIAGFAGERPEADRARHGAYAADRLPADVPALVFWTEVYGVEAGDRQRFRITGPDGRTIHDSDAPIEASNLRWFAFSGLKRPAAGWPPGRYRGTYELTRGGEALVTTTDEVQIGG